MVSLRIFSSSQMTHTFKLLNVPILALPCLHIRHLFAEWPLGRANKWYFFAFEYFCYTLQIKTGSSVISRRFPGPFPENFLNNFFQRIPSTVITYVCPLLAFIIWPVHFQTWFWMSCFSTLSSSEIENVILGTIFRSFSAIRSFEPSEHPCQSLVLEVAVR